MRRVKLRSRRKFCPSDFFARKSWAAMTSRSAGNPSALGIGHLRRHADSGNHAARVGLACPGNVERRAVVWRGANDRKAERDVYALPERQRLDRYQRLVVIHAKRRIVM